MTTPEFYQRLVETRKLGEIGLQDIGLAEAAKRAGLKGTHQIPTAALLRAHAIAVQTLSASLEASEIKRKIQTLSESIEAELDRRFPIGAPRIGREERR